MHKKLTKHGNSLALVIDKPILKLLNLNQDSKLELTLEGDALIIRAAGSKKKSLSKKEKMKLIDRVADEVMDTYEEAFKKLAK